jgi:hypothetical protein
MPVLSVARASSAWSAFAFEGGAAAIALDVHLEDRGVMIEAAKAMLANPDIGVTQIAHRLGVSPATLYRYIPAARTANMPSV